MLLAVIEFLANVLPFQRAAADAGMDMFIQDLKQLSEALK